VQDNPGVRDRPRTLRAFTIVELLLVVVMTSVLIGLLVPALAQARTKSRRITCICNLKQIGLGYRVFATDHGDRFPTQLMNRRSLVAPDPGTSPAIYYRAMSNELATPRVLTCPADTRRPAGDWASFSSTNVSYFVGLDAHESFPQTLLAGDRNLTINGVPVAPGLLAVSTNAQLGWTRELHRKTGNIALGDGSVQQVTETRLLEQLNHQGTETNWLVIP
jgi:competence protein ComGC